MSQPIFSKENKSNSHYQWPDTGILGKAMARHLAARGAQMIQSGPQRKQKVGDPGKRN